VKVKEVCTIKEQEKTKKVNKRKDLLKLAHSLGPIDSPREQLLLFTHPPCPGYWTERW
jgi:hypothetical protein